MDEICVLEFLHDGIRSATATKVRFVSYCKLYYLHVIHMYIPYHQTVSLRNRSLKRSTDEGLPAQAGRR